MVSVTKPIKLCCFLSVLMLALFTLCTGDGMLLTLFTPIPTQNIGTIKNKSETYSKPYVY